MKLVGRAALVALLVVLGLVAGYAASRVFRSEADPVRVIDLDRLPAGDAPPVEDPSRDGGIVVPPPTLVPVPSPPPSPAPPAPSPPPSAPPLPPGGDDGSDDSPDDDGGDDGEFDDD